MNDRFGNPRAFAASRRSLGWQVRSLLGTGLGLALVCGIAGCHKTSAQNSASIESQNAGDPANGNFAPVSGTGATQPAQVLGQNEQAYPQQQGEDYSQQQAAPIERRAPDGSYVPANNGAYQDDSSADQQAQDVYESDLTDEEASEPPPPLPDYDQPPAPDPDYLWTPGYWAWGPGGYYWVPGAWVEAPYVGALWTPGYWGFVGGYYRFHHGFWGLHIGFYGGVDYGYGYVGHGYYGGYWNNGHFFYNTAVNRVNVNAIRNVYVRNVVVNNTVVNNRIINRVSYNGGRGGITARPMAAEVAVMHEQRNAPLAAQVQLRQQASQNHAQFYSQNKGRPAVAVDARPVAFNHQMPAALPRMAAPQSRGAVPNAAQQQRPGMQGQRTPQGGAAPAIQPGNRVQPEVRPVQPQMQNRPEQQVRPVQPQMQSRPGQQVQPERQRPTEPQTQGRPAPQVRQAPEPQVRQAQPQVRQAPQPQVRQEPQRQAAPQPAPQQRPQPQEQARPQPQQAPRPAPQARPAPQPHPAPAARPQERPEDHHPQR
jgi:hypothetical protein